VRVTKSAQSLESLILARTQAGADTASIDKRIWDLFGENWCIVFTDMCGFSRRSAQAGIVPFLVLIHQMKQICTPVWERHSGFVLKTIADSQLILFREPRKAMAACIDAQRALHSHNLDVKEPDRIYLGCGIGYGDVLKLGDDEVFGIEVNFAAKLGEDIAGPYDVLATPGAAKKIGRMKGISFHEVKGGRLGGTKKALFLRELRCERGIGPAQESQTRARSL
jgi:adenylate cyclase